MMNKRGAGRGRRRGSPDTRAHVLEVARRRFLADGYQAVTTRSIAEEAGIDVALIGYFFGSKRGLLGAALALEANPPDVLRDALRGDPATMPERVLRAMAGAWDHPAYRGSLRAVVEAAIQEPDMGNLVREVVEREMISQLAGQLGGADAPQRAAAFGAQMAGIVFARYILELAPIATMPPDELVRYLAPGLHAALQPTAGESARPA
jgi:AcrR family transcriptional regulator